MFATFTSRVLSLTFVLALAACAGLGSIVPQGSPLVSKPAVHLSDAGTIAGSETPAAGSLCSIAGFWYFTASCRGFIVPDKGAVVTLLPYKRMTLSAAIGSNYGTKKDKFIIGEGTNDKDITGTFNGAKFPIYGSVKCVDFNGRTLSCPGHAFLYTMIENASSEELGFSATPAFKIVNNGKYPGLKCQLYNLHASSASTSDFTWLRLPVTGTVKSGTVTFPGWTTALIFKPKARAVYGFTCH